MCGITGFVDYSSKTNPSIINKMMDQIVYRGPDSFGKYTDKNHKVAIGIRRLSIIDLKTGDQPISNEDGSINVVFNGEIYNYRELKKKLVKQGHRFKTNSDTEVLVHLYEKYGEKMPKYLNGMFAFAIWDAVKQRLFIARDRSGIKPLYYYHTGKKFVFGSELKTILQFPGFKKEVNKNALSTYFYLGYVLGEESIFKNIKKLLPGHCLSVGKSAVKIKKYFELSTKRMTDASLDDLLFNSVKMQLHADVPVGVFLSGGLDSSLVAYYISKVKKLKSFSIGFDDKNFDESPYASAVAKTLGTDHFNEIFRPKDVINIYKDISQKLDEPFADSSLLPTYKVSKLARKHVKVVLSGDGADELFGGYPTYQAQILSKYLGHAPLSFIEFLQDLLEKLPENVIDLIPTSFKDYPKKELAKIVLSGVKKEELERHLYLMRTFFLGDNVLYKKPNMKKIRKSIPTLSDPDISKRSQAYDFFTYLPDDFFFKVDRASMYNSLEVRVPYLDNDVLDFAFSKGVKHVDLYQTKIHLRNILKDKLPEVTKRHKKGFGVPLESWFRGELKDFAHSYLDNPKLDEFIPKKRIEKVWKDHQKNISNNKGIIWMLIVFSGWLKNWS